MLSLSVCLNALSDHGACTAVFVAVAFILVMVLSSLRTLGRIAWLAIIGVISIVSAGKHYFCCLLLTAQPTLTSSSQVVTVTIAVAVQDQPVAAPRDVEWHSDYKLFGNPTFAEASSAVSSIIFSYAGTGAFFPIVSEMRDPRLYPRALALCQTLVTAILLIVSIVIYYYCGSYVASPALGSAGPVVKKVSYGIAIPGLLVSGVLLAHVSPFFFLIHSHCHVINKVSKGIE